MSRKIYDVIEAVLALPRAERAVVMERLKESLQQPDVPGGIIVEPQDLVELGARYVFPKNRRYQRETVTVTSKAGPTLSTKWGALVIADPWSPGAAPATPAVGMAAKDYPTAVTVITRTRAETGAGEVLAVAATIGPVADVAAWQPLADDGQFELDSDSSLSPAARTPARAQHRRGTAGGYADHLVPHPRYLIDIDGLDPSWAATMACSGLTAYSAARKVLPLPTDAPVVVIGVGGVGLTAGGVTGRIVLKGAGQ